MKKRSRTVHSEVSKLPAELRGLVERMLVEGATFEDTVEAVNERGPEGVTLKAIEDFFRSSLALQQQRIKRQVQTAEALKKALGDPRSGLAQLADAVLLTGLMRLNKRGADFDFHDAMKEYYQRENLRLKQEVVDLKKSKLELEQKMARARMKTELVKWKLAKGRIIELKRAVEANGKNQKLGPETIQKIQEIYGLVSEPAKRSPAHA